MAKTPKSYWERRAERNLIANEKTAVEVMQSMRRAYNKAIKQVEEDIDVFFAKYSTETGIDVADLRKRMSGKNLTSFKQAQEDYLSMVESLGMDPAYASTLRAFSKRAHITRLEELKANIRHEIELLAAQLHNEMSESLQRGYQDAYYKTLFDIEKQGNMEISFTKPGKKQLEEAVRTRWLSANYSDRVWKNKKALVSAIDQLLPQEFARGKGPGEIAASLAKKLDSSYYAAARLVRTEMNYVTGQADYEAYRQAAIEEYEILATLDSETSDICRDMDGKVFDMFDMQVGVTYPPFHPNCRTTTIPYFPDDEIGPYLTERSGRDENGKSTMIPIEFSKKYSDYADWVEKRTPKAYVEVVKKEPEKYVEMNMTVQEVIDTPVPKTLEHLDERIDEYIRDKGDRLSKYLQGETDYFIPFMEKVFEHNSLSMRRGPRGLMDLLTSGRAKTQFETKSSSGLMDNNVRKKATEKLFGADTTDFEVTDYEKYGYLGSKNAKAELQNFQPVMQYGNWRIDFKKETLWNRTTFTADDSLGPGLRDMVVASKISQPRLASVTSYSYADANKYAKDNIADADKVAQRKLTADIATNIDGGMYIELQFHGDVTVNDIEHIYVTKDTARGHQDLIDKIRDLEIPITIYE